MWSGQTKRVGNVEKPCLKYFPDTDTAPQCPHPLKPEHLTFGQFSHRVQKCLRSLEPPVLAARPTIVRPLSTLTSLPLANRTHNLSSQRDPPTEPRTAVSEDMGDAAAAAPSPCLAKTVSDLGGGLWGPVDQLSHLAPPGPPLNSPTTHTTHA